MKIFLMYSLFAAFTQVFLKWTLKHTPKFDKKDKNIPIYHSCALVVVSMMLFFFGWSLDLLKGTALLMILMFASVSDIQTHEVKDFVSVMIVLTGLIGVSLFDLPLRALSGLCIFVFLFICAVLSKNKLGGADVKLSAACAFVLGLQRGVSGLIIGLFLAVICNLVISLKTKSKGKAFPLVPYLSIGFMLMYFF